MAGNHVLLETIALTQNAASVTFDNIPQTGYTDLKLVFSTRDTTAGAVNNIIVKLNSVTTSQSVRTIQGTGSAASSYGDTPLYAAGNVGNNATANTFSNGELYILNYSSTTQSKSVILDAVSENNATAAQASLNAGLYESNSAITTIQFAPNGAVNFMPGSTFSLYGIATAGTEPTVAPLATGGNIVANDGTYWYHAFINSGNFVPQKELTADYFIVGGGGGARSGGGGAGGFRSFTSQSLVSTNYPVVVGAGSAGASWDGVPAVQGSSSSFNGSTSAGGGGGGPVNNSGQAGGSGGGSANNTAGGIANSGLGNQGNYTPSEGNNGGAWTGGVNDDAACGGGGANAAGAANSGLVSGNGGNGKSSSITGSAVTRGGGGGGGSFSGGTAGNGGTGGGGNGSKTGAGSNGSNYLGGGGGGGNNSPGNGGSGGKGVVIVRWLTSSATVTLGGGAQTDAVSYTDGSYSIREIRNSGTITFS